jgi:hypothetical protein
MIAIRGRLQGPAESEVMLLAASSTRNPGTRARDRSWSRRVRLLAILLPSWLLCAAAVRAGSADRSLGFATFLGGSLGDTIRDVVFGADGSVYLTGATDSADFPTTPGAWDRTLNGNFDVVVTKLDASGRLVWSTYLGGPNYDRAYAIEVDDRGGVYVAGRAGAGYPTTSGVLQPRFGGDVNAGRAYGKQDGFVTKLSADGSGLEWSTYFGSDDGEVIRDLDVDGSGRVVLAVTAVGRRHPHITPGVFQPELAGGTDHVVAKLSSDARRVEWASYLGGSGDDGWPPSIRVDAAGAVVFLGHTFSDDLPVTPGAFQRRRGGGVDLFLAKIAPDGSELLYLTYFGGSRADGTETHGLAIDDSGHAYIAAMTESTDLPVTSTSFQPAYGGSGGSSTGANSNYPGDGFVAKLSPDGTRLLAATFLGGSEGEGIEGVDVDGQGNVWVSGATYSHDFPVTANALQPNLAGAADFFVAQLSGNLETLRLATFLGGLDTDYARGLDADAAGNAVVGGITVSSDWPTHRAWQPTFAGGADAALAKLVATSDTVFADDFESGDTSSWHASRGRLLRVVQPGLKGSKYALAVSPGGSAERSFLESGHLGQLGAIRVGFLVSPNRVELGGGRVEILRLSGQRGSEAALALEEHGSRYRVRLFARDGSREMVLVGSVELPARRATRLKVEWRRASGPAESDGEVGLFKRKKRAARLGGLRNGAATVKEVLLGLPQGSAGTMGSGLFLIDNFVSRH